MRKAIGVIGCTTLLAVTVSLWLAGGGEPSSKVSAQIDRSASSPFATDAVDAEYDAVGRRLLEEARKRAAAGDTDSARKLAERASTFPVNWAAGEQTPAQFIASLKQRSGGTSAVDMPPLEQLATRPEKEQALFLLKSARADMNAGRFEQARAKVLQAKHFDVTYTLFEERPEHVLAEIERKSATVTIAGATPTPPPAASPTPSPAQSDSRAQQAQALLKSARVAITSGRFGEARAKALEAQKLDVAYGLFDDRPELVLRDLEQISQQATVAATATPSASASQNGNPLQEQKQIATRLLAEARKALKDGQIEQARQKVQEASQYQVSYEVFEDRPELVLSEINRAAARTSSPAAVAATGPAGQGTNASQVQSDAIAQKYAQAQQLITQARADLAAGNLDAARAKAAQADALQVTYRLFDDRPDLVINDIERVLEKQVAATGPSSSGTPADTASLAAAQELLRQARQDIAAGRLSAAREKAAQAQQMHADYSAFDDRPELVIAEINRLIRTEAQTPMPSTAPTPASAANPFQVAQSPTQSTPRPAAEPNPFEPDSTTPSTPIASTAAATPQDQPTPNTGTAPRPVMSDQNVQPIPQTVASADATLDAPEGGIEQAAVVHPAGASAVELYNQGLYHLRHNDRDAARDAFLKAYAAGETLDFYRRQQLQDFLRELTPRSEVQLTSAEMPTQIPIGPSVEAPIDIAEQQQALQYDRLRTEVLNAVFRAERLKETDSDQALEVLDRVTASVENANLSEDASKTLLRHITNAADSVKAHQEQRAPVVELERQNRETRDLIEQDRQAKIRVEQEFAKLVEEYNELFEQRRYGEAEIKAKQAKELDPDNPVAVTMVWKSRFARRVARDDETRELKEDSWVRTMQDVDDDVINQVIDNPIAYPDAKTWKELTTRRKDYGGDNRIRTDEEKRIEQSLTRQVSLHFDNSPLKEVIAHISSVANINVVLDQRGLSDESVSTTDPVSIDVDGIQLKSALKLMLEPLKLGYTIENEVLKITSAIRQQGKLMTVTYPVADLVVPITNYNTPTGSSTGFGATDNFGSAGAQFSVPSGGVQRSSGNAMFQVNDFNPGGGFNNDFGLGNGLDAPEVSGGSSIDFESLMDLIVTTVEPETWSEVGMGGTIRSFETTLSLVIRQTQQVHEEIADLLAQLRRLQDLQVTVEVRFIAVSDRFFERIGVDFDFNVQDTLGTPYTYPAFGTPGQANQQGQNQNQNQNQNQQNQQNQQGSAGQFFESNSRRTPSRDDYPSGTIVGLANPSSFTPDFDVAFQQGSFELGVPDFGNFNPDAGIQVGMAILSDIEAFFFIQAAQADERANLMFAPKVTLFNGQVALVRSIVQRPFVISLTPTVGFFSVGFTPQVQLIPEGVQLTVQAVISADRRYVRLTVEPNFTNITDVFTFSFLSSGGGGGGLGGGGFGGQGGGFGGGGFGGGGFGGGGFGGGGFGGGGFGGQGFGGIGGFGGQGGGFGGQGGGAAGGFQGQQGQQGQQGFGGGQEVTVQQPVQEQVTVNTTVSVPDGGTVLLGGIKRLREGRNMAGVPILNKVPYVSRLFKNTGVGRETESIMLMVTPRIIIQEEEEELLGLPL